MKDLKCFFSNVFESVSSFMNTEIMIGEVEGGADKMATSDVVMDQIDKPETVSPEVTEVTQGHAELQQQVEVVEQVPVAQIDRSNPGTLQPTEAPAVEPQEAVQQSSDLFADQEAKKKAVQKERQEIASSLEADEL